MGCAFSSLLLDHFEVYCNSFMLPRILIIIGTTVIYQIPCNNSESLLSESPLNVIARPCTATAVSLPLVLAWSAAHLAHSLRWSAGLSVSSSSSQCFASEFPVVPACARAAISEWIRMPLCVHTGELAALAADCSGRWSLMHAGSFLPAAGSSRLPASAGWATKRSGSPRCGSRAH
jgi:hypothetical protein